MQQCKKGGQSGVGRMYKLMHCSCSGRADKLMQWGSVGRVNNLMQCGSARRPDGCGESGQVHALQRHREGSSAS